MELVEWKWWFRYVVDILEGSVSCKKKLYEWYNIIQDNIYLIKKMEGYINALYQTMMDNKESMNLSSLKVMVPEEDKWIYIIALILHSKNLEKLFEKMNFASDIFKSTIEELLRKMEATSREGKQVYDINIEWINRVFTFNIIQLGRLQFGFGTITEPLYVVQNQVTKELKLFLDNQWFNEIGYIEEGEGKKEEVSRSKFEETELYLKGTEINIQEGRFLGKEICLMKPQWRLIRKPGDQIIEVHIPYGKRLEKEACIESFNRFEEICNLIPYKSNGYICRSWLMGGSIQSYRKPDSNIGRFRRLFALYPCYRSEKEIWRRVFNQEVKPEKDFVPRTELQRNLLNGYKKNEKFFGGAGIRL